MPDPTPTAYVATQIVGTAGPDALIITSSFDWSIAFIVNDTVEMFTIPANYMITDWSIVVNKGLAPADSTVQLVDVAHAWAGGYWSQGDTACNAAVGWSMRTSAWVGSWNTMYVADDKLLIKVTAIGATPAATGKMWGNMTLVSTTTQATPYTTEEP